MKVIYLAGALALALTFGCNSTTEETEVIETETVKEVEVEKTTVNAEPVKEAPQPTKVVVVEKEKEKGTSIQIGKEGGSFKNKDIDIGINK